MQSHGVKHVVMGSLNSSQETPMLSGVSWGDGGTAITSMRMWGGCGVEHHLLALDPSVCQG